MRHTFFFLLLLGMLTACNSGTSSTDNTGTTDSNTESETTNTPTEPEKPEFKVLDDFDKDNLHDEIDVKGKVIDGIKFQDANGINYVVVDEYTEGEFFTESFKSELYVSGYYESGEIMEVPWTESASNPSAFEAISYQKRYLDVKDVDGDGIAEVSFIYTIQPDGLDPGVLTLAVIHKGKNYPISGVIPTLADSWDDQYEKNISEELAAAPQAIQDYANEAWEGFVSGYKKNLAD